MNFEHKESFSNLAYPLVGVICYLLFKDPLFLVLTIQMGVGSYIYHRYKENNPEIFRADWFAIHLTLNGCTGMLSQNDTIWLLLGIYSALYGFLLMGSFKKWFGKWAVYVEVALSAIPTFIAVIQDKEWWSLVVFAVFGIAIYIRAKDENPEQDRHHDSKEHSIWHVLTAIGFALIVYL